MNETTNQETDKFKEQVQELLNENNTLRDLVNYKDEVFFRMQLIRVLEDIKDELKNLKT